MADTATYANFTMYFPTRTVVIYGRFSEPLAAGLMAGFYLAADALAEVAPEAEKAAIMNTRASFFGGATVDLLGVYDRQDYIEPYKENRQILITRHGNDSYILVVDDIYNPDDPNYDVYIFDREQDLREFLQGLLTIVKAFNINPETVLLAAPFKGNQDYAIQGMNLPLMK